MDRKRNGDNTIIYISNVKSLYKNKNLLALIAIAHCV